MIGSVIDGAYKVKSRLGEGAFGVVYECEETQLGRTVALKMLDPEHAGEREMKRFMAEGRNLASLNHSNVVQIYRLGEHEGKPFIVMEHLQGRTLREMTSKGHLPMRHAVDILRQLALGLQAIHARDILHHDLSPNNMLVTDSGTAKILDLGLSRDLNTLTSFDTQNFLVGTLAYLAPEQVQGQGSSFRAEIFSFGIIMYEVFSGRHPFWAEHHTSQLYNIAHRDPEPLDVVLRDCPLSLANLVMQCLEKRPEERPKSMGEVAEGLAKVLVGTSLDSASSTMPLSSALPRRVTSTNPYLNRVMIKRGQDFYGRQPEVKRIYSRLNATPPGSISVVGERKIGKSSLLNYVYMRHTRQKFLEAPESMVMVFLDLQAEKNMSMESFVRALLGIANYELRGRLDVSDCALSLDGIKDMVQRLDGAGFRLAILLDEFDTITTNPSFDLQFFSFLRYLANHYNVAYVTSSARDLQMLCHAKEISDSPFFNIFSTMRLSVFRREEAEQLIREPSARAGRPLAPHTENLLEMAGFFPFFLQMACSHTLEWLEENEGKMAPDFTEVRRLFLEEASLHYRYIWEGLDAHQRSALVRVAESRGVPDALQHVLAELESKHYVERDDGKARLFAATFRDFVRAEAKRRGTSMWGKLFGRRGA